MIVPVDEVFKTIKTKYSTFENPKIFVASYDGTGDNLALLIENEDGVNEKLTVNVEEYYTGVPRNVVAIKDYSEHEGLAKSLEDAGVGRIASQIAIGRGRGYFMLLNFDAATLYETAVKELN